MPLRGTPPEDFLPSNIEHPTFKSDEGKGNREGANSAKEVAK
jgi:hypothetical protein